MATKVQMHSQVSYVIRNLERWRHRNSVSSLQLDPFQGRLYSSGRDGIIRVWNTADDVQHRYIQSIKKHNDWVNDTVVCCGGKIVISASSDTTVKVWNASNGYCLSNLHSHKYCVRALAYAKNKEQVASAGRDKTIYLWDINTLTAYSVTYNEFTPSCFVGNKESVYSLAINPAGTVLVSGSVHKILRVWDPRNNSQVMKLKGFGNKYVMALVVSPDGTQCVSGSSDGTIRRWLLGEQRCVSIIKVHSGAVWALLATENFLHIISGGQDQQVIITELSNPDNFMIVCEETAPILKICFSADQQRIWVSTLDSDIRCWKLEPLASKPETNNQNNVKRSKTSQTAPIIHIPGGSDIVPLPVDFQYYSQPV